MLRTLLLALAVCALLGPAAARASNPPHAQITIDPQYPRWDRPASYSAQSSYDSDGNIVSYAWDLDEDNQFDDAEGPTAEGSYAYPGYHGVRVKVTDDSGDSSIAYGIFLVWGSNLQPSTSPWTERFRVHPGDDVVVHANAHDLGGSVVGYEWDLDDDGQFDDADTESATTRFATVGTHPVAVRVTDDEGATDVGLIRIEAYSGNDPPSAAIQGAVFHEGYEVGQDEDVYLGSAASDSDGQIVAYAWDLDEDGLYDDSTEQEPSVRFSTPGEHVVRLRVTDDEGATTEVERAMRVHDGNFPPRVDVRQDWVRARAGRPVRIDSGASDRDGYVLSHAWDLDGDGSFDDGDEYSAYPTFDTAGDHLVRVRVRDEDGGSAVGGAIVTTHVGNEPPVVRFSWQQEGGWSRPARAGQVLNFSAGGWDPDGYASPKYAWDLDDDGQFDDGAGDAATRSFDAPGEYPVRVRATDSEGATGVAEHNVEVGPATLPPEAQASVWITPSPFRVGRPVRVSARNSGDPDGGVLSYAWDLDEDGEFDDSGDPEATARFAATGAHFVSVRVTDDEGETDTARVDVDVIEANRPPAVQIGRHTQPMVPEAGERVRLSGGGGDWDGGVTELAWDLDDDGEFDDAQGHFATATFPAAGDHVVRLRARDDEGATATDRWTVRVFEKPQPPPYLQLSAERRAPRSGQEIDIYASTPREAQVRWDLDDDGDFDDAAGTVATTSFHSPGVHRVRASSAFASGATAVRELRVAVHEGNLPPRGTISTDPARPRAGRVFTLAVDAQDLDGHVASIEWDLDDDGRYEDGEGNWLETSFATAGDHVVRARLTDGEGAASVVRAPITVDPARSPPPVSIHSSPRAPKANRLTVLEAAVSHRPNVVAYAWDTDDDGQFDDGDESFVYASFAAGTPTVRLRVTDETGAQGVATRELDVHEANYAPTAEVRAHPGEPRAGGYVTLFSTVGDEDGVVWLREWDLDDDGEFDDGWGESAYLYDVSAGPQRVRMRATDDSGASVVAELVLDPHEGNRAPRAVALVDDASPDTGQAVRLSGYTSSDDSDGQLSFEWDLDGDGAFELGGSQVVTAFDTPGVRTVTMRAIDAEGASDQTSFTVDVQRVNVAPRAAFSYSPSSPRVGDEVTFESSSGDRDGTLAAHGWDLDDDGAFDDATGPQVRHRFLAAGTYDVRLRVVDDEGLADVVRRTVRVKVVDPPPVVDPPVVDPPPVVVDPPGGGDPPGGSGTFTPPIGGDAPPAAPGSDAQPDGEPGEPAPALPLTVRPRPARQRLAQVLRRGLLLSVSCAAACDARLELRVSDAARRRLHLASRVVGSTRVRLAAGGSRTFRLRLTAKARRALEDVRSLHLTVNGAGRPLPVKLGR